MTNYLKVDELVTELRETLLTCEARRAQYRSRELDVQLDVAEGNDMDVIAKIRDGQLAVFSATFVQEIVNVLGRSRQRRQIPVHDSLSR
jgi:hypothetical protein